MSGVRLKQGIYISGRFHVPETYGENFSGEDNFSRYYRLAVPERFNFLYAKLDEFPNKLYKAFEDRVLYEDQM